MNRKRFEDIEEILLGFFFGIMITIGCLSITIQQFN